MGTATVLSYGLRTVQSVVVEKENRNYLIFKHEDRTIEDLV